jgi:hypothetical protein
VLEKARSDATALNTIALRQLKLTNAGLVFGDDQIFWELFGIVSRGSVSRYCKTLSADSLGNAVGMEPDFGRSLNQGTAGIYHADRVVNVSLRNGFSGHVYNLENGLNWYSSNTCIVHNCRCVSKPIIQGFID